MVSTVTGAAQNKEADCQRALIVEIIGPAGAGKTTLFKALKNLDAQFRTEYLPPVQNYRYLPFFIKNSLLLLPTLLRLQLNGGRKLNRRELAWMAILKGWPQILKKEATASNQVILLDQGPVFLMATLNKFGPESLQNSNVQGYWKKTCEHWAHTLDVVVWLDTSDEILIERIRTRQKGHPVKGETDQKMKDFLAIFREEYERLINTLQTSNPEIRVLRMDSGENSVDDLLQKVMAFTHKKEMEVETYEPV